MSGHGTLLLGLLGAVVVAGPLLRSEAVLDLDFVLLPHAPLPNGFWGLGPELPRRTPVMLPITWLGPVIGSVAAGKLMAVVLLAAAFVGATRLARGVPAPWRYAAGALYAFGPFATTRLAVGHLFVLAAMAVLPFALPRLLRPADDPGRTFLWSLALALTGFLGGVFALVCVGVGAVGTGRRGLRAIAYALLAQVPWLAPGIVVVAQGADLASSEAFRPDVAGLGVLGLGSGHGFWQESFQVGWGTDAIGAIAAVAIMVLALAGRRGLASRQPRLMLVALAALAFVVASTLSVTRPLIDLLLELPGGGIVRETQRVLPLFLVWAAPAAAIGAERLAGRRREVQADLLRPAALVVALVLMAPGLWGAGGQLRPVEVPAEWNQVRDLVRAEPGTVLALPWFLYVDLDIADGRRVLNPLPLWLGGDVLAASDPRLPGVTARERADPREPWATEIVIANLGGEPVAEDLAALGVRWVAVLADGGTIRGRTFGSLHAEALSEDGGLRLAFDGETIDLFEVEPWRGVVVAGEEVLELDPIVGPVARLAASGPAVYARPFASGWMRGTSPAEETERGLVALPAGSGPVWYWPSVVVLISYLSVAIGTSGIYLQQRSKSDTPHCPADDLSDWC